MTIENDDDLIEKIEKVYAKIDEGRGEHCLDRLKSELPLYNELMGLHYSHLTPPRASDEMMFLVKARDGSVVAALSPVGPDDDDSRVLQDAVLGGGFTIEMPTQEEALAFLKRELK